MQVLGGLAPEGDAERATAASLSVNPHRVTCSERTPAHE
jgi:hypothetical protein